jgi:(2Fe-2S) ferredoxin
METQDNPFEVMVLVCTKPSKDGAITCGAPGEEIRAYLKEKIKEKKLNDRVRVVKSGCLGKCSVGPNVMIVPKGDWHSVCSMNDVDQLLEKTLAALP